MKNKIIQSHIYFGEEVLINQKVVCIDGSKWEDYSFEEHLKNLGFSLNDNKKDQPND